MDVDDVAIQSHVVALAVTGSSTNMVLVTSRDRLAGLVATNGATRIGLEPVQDLMARVDQPR